MRWPRLKLFFLVLLTIQAAQADPILVTGKPAGVDFLREVLTDCGWSEFPSRALAPGESWKAPSGERVINIDWEPPAALLAALSDHPEKVENRGGLFFGGLTPFRPLIFQYYHLGKLRGPSPNLTLVVQNPSSKPATIHIRKGVGRTSLDYFSSGHTNNVRWFSAANQNLGVFAKVEPGQTLELFRQPLPPEEVVSGTLGLTQTEGDPLSFAFVARPDTRERLSLNNLLKEDDVHSRGFYPAARQVMSRHFEVGGEPLHLAVGAVRQPTFSGVRELRGDYGVTYQMRLRLSNPTDRPSRVEFLFNPRGGAATGTILLNGETIEVANTEAFKERLFHSVELSPRATETVLLETIPEGASSYPVRIVVREGNS